jgi:hypothetical protein
MVRRSQKQHRLWAERALLGNILIGALLIGLAAAGPANAQSQYAQSQSATTRRMPPLRELVVQYRALALRAEFGGQARRGRIIKWAGPILVALRGANVDVYEPEVLRHLALLARLTGLRYRVVRAGYPGPAPNMIVTFVHNGGRGPRNLENVCSARVYSGPDYVIRRATVTIHADWNLLRRHCILEELTQALGLMNDSSYFSPSIFNDHSKQQALSPWDRLMVRAHYDRRIRPGMSWAYAGPIVRDHFRRRLAALYRPLHKRHRIRRTRRRR